MTRRSFIAGAGDLQQRHLAFDVRLHRDVQNLPHSRQPRTLFDDLLDGPIIAARYYGHARPLRIVGLSHGQRFDIESPGAKQADDARKLARLVSNYN